MVAIPELRTVRSVFSESQLHVYRGRDMFDKLHLLSQDVPGGGQGVRWRKHSYLRVAVSGAKGPTVFDWDERQRKDLHSRWPGRRRGRWRRPVRQQALGARSW